MTSTEMPEGSAWTYEPAADRDQRLSELLQGFPREPHLWMYALRTAAALIIRAWLRLYHRYEIIGAERLPIGSSFILVANHQSHLDAPCLVSSIPLRYLHRAFPAAAADYFFKGLPSSAFSSIVVNGLPFRRKARGAASLVLCRELLRNDGNILIIFPEGTRSTSGELGTFRPGIGHLAAGSEVQVIPCYLRGAHRALPKGAAVPRPRKLTLCIGEPRSYAALPPGKDSYNRIAADLEAAVRKLGTDT
ncbi:MAG: 1-acyl-sn-glycerol-3-phosphate acyltransferase [Rhodothermales bacterium]|nr:1-acyl-sn-glycerol-3-phosphate acyltransferase [Rhodothermales bacterium]